MWYLCHGFNPQIDRAAIRRTDYPAMGGKQLVTESQAHKWVQAGLDRHRLLSQRRRRRQQRNFDCRKKSQRRNRRWSLMSNPVLRERTIEVVINSTYHRVKCQHRQQHLAITYSEESVVLKEPVAMIEAHVHLWDLTYQISAIERTMLRRSMSISTVCWSCHIIYIEPNV